jgi:hypothetical protein
MSNYASTNTHCSQQKSFRAYPKQNHGSTTVGHPPCRQPLYLPAAISAGAAQAVPGIADFNHLILTVAVAGIFHHR